MAKTDRKDVSTMESSMMTYVDKDGIEQSIDLSKVKNLGDTQYAESKRLYPNATPCMIDKEGSAFDEDGRQNILNQNIVLVGATRMTAGDYGPWFLCQGLHPEIGEISFPAPGMVANEAVEALTGIALTDKYDGKKKIASAGEKFSEGEGHVFCRFEFVPEKGQYGNGYFVILPAREELEPVNSDE